MAQREFTQIFPKPGWVEHNPHEIWSSQASVIAEAIAAIAKPQGGAPRAPEAGQKQKPGKPSKKDILGIEDKKERMAAIAANIDLFK